MTTTYRALLVANSTFPDDVDNLPELEGPRNDAALLREALCDRSYGLFASDNVRLVQERPMSDVLREVEDFLRSASRQDTLLLYYSGHGVLDQSNEFFLCAQNSRTDRLRSTAVKASDISEMINESAAATTLIFLDCCHSGRFKSGDVPSRLAGEGRFVVTSSRGGELARDAHAQNHASLFTHHLVEGLLGRAPDHDHDGLVSLTDLYDYVHDALRDAGRQIPQKRFEGSGDVPIAMRPGSTAVAEDPDLLDPASAAPVLDVSTTDLDLGHVGADEVLPPERILVINRGGGTLAWTVRTSADWIQAVPDETGVDLHLQPVAGANRANVYVTDEHTGALQTVRVRVRVGEAPVAGAPPVAAPPEPTTPAVAPAESNIEAEPEVTPPAATAVAPSVGANRIPVLATAAALAALVAAAWSIWTAIRFSAAVEDNDGTVPIIRTKHGVGLLETLMVACAVAAFAIAVLRRRRTSVALGAMASATLAVGMLRLTEQAQFNTWTWVAEFDGFTTAAWLAMLAAGLAIAAIVTDRTSFHRPRRPTRAGVVALVLAVLWAISLGQDLYDHDDFGLIGDHVQERLDGSAWQVVTAVVLVALVAGAATCLADTVGHGVLLGIAAVPLAMSISEIVFVIVEGPDGSFDFYRMPILLVPSLAFAAWSILVAVRRRPLTAPG